VALGDGTPEDRDALEEICFKKYNGKVFLLKGYVPKDEICDNGIIEVIRTSCRNSAPELNGF